MLYTLSQSDYPKSELDDYFANITEKDAVVLWQAGVLLAVKYPAYFADCEGICVMLEEDILARNLTAFLPNAYPKANKVRLISMLDFVDITERYAPQLAL